MSFINEMWTELQVTEYRSLFNTREIILQWTFVFEVLEKKDLFLRYEEMGQTSG